MEFAKKNMTTVDRGILVANSFPHNVMRQLKESKLEFKAIPWQDIFPTLKRPKTIKQARSLDEFLG